MDSLLETRKEKGEAEGVQRGAYITITFLGFYDAKRNGKFKMIFFNESLMSYLIKNI